MRGIVAVIVALGLIAFAVPAGAMSFHLAKTKSGLSVVMAKGEITKGDARRLKSALARAGRDQHGTKQLWLDSPGGLVAIALDMADIMDAEGVTTVVGEGALCASACASVLFVSGKYRRVDSGGALAIHSCYDSRNGHAMTDCNAAISAHAEFEGVSGSTLMALQEAAGSEAIIVFDKDDAACFGLTLQPGARPSTQMPPCMKKALKRAKR
jgi:hypothetical protein